MCRKAEAGRQYEESQEARALHLSSSTIQGSAEKLTRPICHEGGAEYAD
jgi:hypothetical protein